MESALSASRPAAAITELKLSVFTSEQVQGLLDAATFRWGSPWKERDFLASNLGIVASKDLKVTADGGYSIQLTNIYPPPPPAPFALGGGPAVGVGRTAVHALWVEEPGGLALETPYLAEVVCVVVPKRHPRRLYVLAQFHEVRSTVPTPADVHDESHFARV